MNTQLVPRSRQRRNRFPRSDDRAGERRSIAGSGSLKLIHSRYRTILICVASAPRVQSAASSRFQKMRARGVRVRISFSSYGPKLKT